MFMVVHSGTEGTRNLPDRLQSNYNKLYFTENLMCESIKFNKEQI